MLLLVSCKSPSSDNNSRVRENKTHGTPENRNGKPGWYKGKWIFIENALDSKVPELSFSLVLKDNEHNDSIIGKYCAIAQRGNKIDCSPDSAEWNMKGAVIDDSTIHVTFYSLWDNSKGEAFIHFVNASKVEWEIVERGNGVCFAPSKCGLMKYVADHRFARSPKCSLPFDYEAYLKICNSTDVDGCKEKFPQDSSERTTEIKKRVMEKLGLNGEAFFAIDNNEKQFYTYLCQTSGDAEIVYVINISKKGDSVLANKLVFDDQQGMTLC